MALGRQHPVLSPIGCLGGLVFVAGVTVALLVSGGAIFSPGELTAYAAQGKPIKGFKAHADFENNCLECHQPLHGITTEQCETCHTDVNEQRTTGTGLHGHLTNVDVANCESCHRDHRGRAFDPNELALKKFDHAVIGFSLAWHFTDYDKSPMKCEACHTQTTFSLDTASCSDCHRAYDATFMTKHTEAFGSECLACHDGVDKMHNFDHAQTKFPLDGKHAAVDCADCHKAAVAAPDTPTNCAACHNEPPVHAGMFGADCAECHTPAAWKPAKLGDKAAFDHADTGFQLINHVKNYDGSALTCRMCHTTANDFSVSTQACADCHTSHDADFMTKHVQQYGPNCTSCHDGAGNMKNFDHNAFFLLDGRHATVECAACHANQQFKGTPKECSACHREPEIHAGVFGLKCDSCHTTTAWSPAQLIRHTFPLDHGGQGEIACATCHTSSYTTYTCYGCHEHDPAKTQDEHKNVDLSSHPLDDCAACHATGQKQEGGN